MSPELREMTAICFEHSTDKPLDLFKIVFYTLALYLHEIVFYGVTCYLN